MATPGDLEALRSRVAALLARRGAALEEAAAAWAGFARRQGWTRSDVECLWEGLTEDLVRRCARQGAGQTAEGRQEVLAVMAAIRRRILDGLEPPGRTA